MNRLIEKCLVIVFVFLLAACGKDLTPQESIAEARNYVAADDFSAASISLKNAALKYPDNAEVRFELAGVSLALGDAAGAEKEARRAIELGMPPEQVTLLTLAAIYLQGDFDRVLTESKNISDTLKANVRADILAYRAHALIRQQQYRLADVAIQDALSLDEGSVMAVLAKASYEAQVGRRETAMTLAKKATELDPTSPDAWALLGDLHAANNELPAAKEAYDKAVANRAYVSLSMARRAFIAAQLGQFAEATSDLKALYFSGYKDQPYVNFVKGYTAFREAKYPAASEALEKSVAADPKNPLSKLYLAASLIKEEKLEQARILANQLYADIPNSVEVARMFASIDIQKQDFGAARGTLGALLEVNKDDPVALGMLGSMALMEGNGDQAVDYFQRLLTESPDDQSVQRMLNLAMTMRGDFVAEVVTAAEQQVPPAEFDRALLSAATALKQGQLKEALAIAENLHQQFPDRVDPLKMLATIYLSVGDWRKGQSLLEQTLTIDPLEPSAIKTLAKIYLQTGEEARAVQLLTPYLKDNPLDKEAIGVMSELIVATNTYQQGETQLIELLEKNPENLEVKSRLAQLYFDNGKYDQVVFITENMSDDVIKAQPLLMELRGKSFINQGDAGAAAKVWEKWVKLSPDLVLANFYFADSLVQSKQLERALESLEVCRQLKPGYLPARLALVRVNAQTGNMDKAFAEMQKLRGELTAERGDVWYTQGWLSAKAGNYADAEQSLQKSLALEPTPETALLLFAALNNQDRSDEALRSLEGWLEKFPRSTSMLVILGQSYLAQKETDKAIGIYQRLLEVDPQSVLALNNLAWLVRDKDPKQALVFANRASALAPEDPYVMSTLGALLAANGQAVEGEQLLRKAVALYPDNIQSKLDLARLLLNLGRHSAAQPYLQEVIGSKGADGLVAEAKTLLEASHKGANLNGDGAAPQ